MDKFIIQKVRAVNPTLMTVRIHLDAYNQLQRMQAETGRSFADLVDACVMFCAKRMEVIDPEE